MECRGLVVVHVNADDAVFCYQVSRLSVLRGYGSRTGAVAVRVGRVDRDVECTLEKIIPVLCLNLADRIGLGAEPADEKLSLGIRVDRGHDVGLLIRYLIVDVIDAVRLLHQTHLPGVLCESIVG